MTKLLRCTLALLASLTLASCGHAPETHFYTLAPVGPDTMAPPVNAHVIPVTLGQVNLPQILNRDQLIRRPSPDRVTILPFDRWAAPLDDDLSATLTVDLQQRLPPNSLIRSDGSPYDTSVGIIDLYIDRFDTDAAGHVTFDVAWTVTNGNPQKTLLRRTEHIEQDAADGSSAAMVAAMSRSVAQLATQIAAGLPAR